MLECSRIVSHYHQMHFLINNVKVFYNIYIPEASQSHGGESENSPPFIRHIFLRPIIIYYRFVFLLILIDLSQLFSGMQVVWRWLWYISYFELSLFPKLKHLSNKCCIVISQSLFPLLQILHSLVTCIWKDSQNISVTFCLKFLTISSVQTKTKKSCQNKRNSRHFIYWIICQTN